MCRVIVIGAGICGLGTALLLARDGHDVLVLEKDSSRAPQSIDDCWDGWTRRGVAQFRQPHNFMPGLRLILEAELPEVQDTLVRAGATRFDMLNPAPPWLQDTPAQPIDDQLWTYTCRRPTGEWAFLQVAEAEKAIHIRRGVAVAGLVDGSETRAGTPHVTGVRTAAGEMIEADLVVDASGRGTRSREWLAELGAASPDEHRSEGHFTYYTRYFSGADPERRAPPLTEFGSISILTLPGDRGTWSVTIFAASDDRPLKALARTDAWMRVVAGCPLHAHWLDGEPISDVLAMGGVVDCYRRLVRDRAPAVTGFVAVADAWSCTNPSAGRGMTIGMMHALRLRDALRLFPDDPWQLAVVFDEVTERELRLWYDAQLASDDARFEAMRASRSGEKPAPARDPLTRDLQLLRAAMMTDGELFRLGLEYVGTLAPAQEIMARPGVRERMQEAVEQLAENPPPAPPGPDRAQLLDLLAGG